MALESLSGVATLFGDILTVCVWLVESLSIFFTYESAFPMFSLLPFVQPGFRSFETSSLKVQFCSIKTKIINIDSFL